MNKTEAFMQLHINVVVNILSTFVVLQQGFTIMIDGSSEKYRNQFPEMAYVDKNLIVVDISNWSLEQSSVTPADSTISTKIVYGESDVYDVVIDAFDVLGIVINTMSVPMYTRFFSAESISKLKEESEPQVRIDHIIDTTLFEETNKNGIAKSMLCLTLLEKEK